MAAIDDLEVIRELLAAEPPSLNVNDHVKGQLNAVIAAAESHQGAGRPARHGPRARRTVAGLARQRRRRLVLRSVAGAAAALAAAAVALAAAGVPGTHWGGTEGPALDAAYVVKRIDSALGAAEPGDVARMTVTTRAVPVSGGTTTTTTAEEWSHGGQWRLVTYSPAGHLVYDEGATSSFYTLVSYPTRTWARQPEPGGKATPIPGSRGCVPAFAFAPPPSLPGLPGGGFAASSRPSTVATALRAAVLCGTLAVAGRQRVDGIEAIELTSRPDSQVPVTIWVDPGKYLPVRVAVRPAAGQSGPWQTADITWLPPTAQNLARLAVPVPAGFRQVPLTQLVRPVLIPIGTSKSQ
jgi:hypothetical protein